MPKKSTGEKMVSYSISLPPQAVELIDGLIPIGLHGSSRVEVTRTLILNRLEQIFGPDIFRRVLSD